jgi:DNA modification methylase
VEALDQDNRIIWAETGRPYLKWYLREQEGTPISSVITDIPPLSHAAAERLGYPTQKPMQLLERIVEASSNPNDIVLDPFCGCGTAIEAALRQKRRWIGIDITIKAIRVIRGDRIPKLGTEFADSYEVIYGRVI